MSDEEIAEIWGIVRAGAEELNPESVVIMQCSHRLVSVDTYLVGELPEQIEVKDRGGNRLPPGIRVPEEPGETGASLSYLRDGLHGRLPRGGGRANLARRLARFPGRQGRLFFQLRPAVRGAYPVSGGAPVVNTGRPFPPGYRVIFRDANGAASQERYVPSLEEARDIVRRIGRKGGSALVINPHNAIVMRTETTGRALDDLRIVANRRRRRPRHWMFQS